MTAIGHIYKIICLVDSKFCYIGSTFSKLNERFRHHLKGFIKWLKNGENKKGMSCYPFYKKYGIENFKIILIKSYEVCKTHCKDSKHLWAYETLWINKTKCCNLILPIQYLKKQRRKWRAKQYSQNNKTILAVYKKQYNQDNKKKINEQRKQYRQNNKEAIAKKRSEKVICECGCILGKGTLSRHRKSKKHIDLMKQK